MILPEEMDAGTSEVEDKSGAGGDDDFDEDLPVFTYICAQLTRIQRALGLKRRPTDMKVKTSSSPLSRKPIEIDDVPFHSPERQVKFVALDVEYLRYSATTIDTQDIVGFEQNGAMKVKDENKKHEVYQQDLSMQTLQERLDEYATGERRDKIKESPRRLLSENGRRVIVLVHQKRFFPDALGNLDLDLSTLTNVLDVVDIMDIANAARMRHHFLADSCHSSPDSLATSSTRMKRLRANSNPFVTLESLFKARLHESASDEPLLSRHHLMIKYAVRDTLLRPTSIGFLGGDGGDFPGAPANQAASRKPLPCANQIDPLPLRLQAPKPSNIREAEITYKRNAQKLAQALYDAAKQHCQIKKFAWYVRKSYMRREEDEDGCPEYVKVEETILVIAPSASYTALANLVRDKAPEMVSECLLGALEKELVCREMVDEWHRNLPVNDSRRNKLETHEKFTEVMRGVKEMLNTVGAGRLKSVQENLAAIREDVLKQGWTKKKCSKSKVGRCPVCGLWGYF